MGYSGLIVGRRWGAVLLATAAVASTPPAQPPAEVAGWAMVAPFSSRETHVFEREPATGTIDTGDVLGLALVCTGPEPIGCERANLEKGVAWRGTAVEAKPTLVTGELRVGDRPARAAVGVFVRHDGGLRPLYVPLGLDPAGKPLQTIEADELGLFRLPLLLPGAYQLEIQRKDGSRDLGPSFEITAPRLPPGVPHATLDLGVVALELGEQLVVHVVDDLGNGVVGASVSALQDPTGVAPRRRRSSSREGGVVVLSGLDVTMVTHVGCTAEGYRRGEVRVESLADSPECVVARLGSIEARIVAASNNEEPLPGAWVEVEGPDGAVQNVTANDGGVVAVSQLPPGWHRVRFGADHFVGRSLGFELAAGSQRRLGDIELDSTYPLRGEVVDTTSRDPIVGARVRVVEPPARGVVESAADGSFEVPSPLTGRVSLAVEAPGYAPARVEYTIPEDPDEAFVTVELGSAGFLHIVVWAQGYPCAGCRVFVAPAEDVGLGLGAGGSLHTGPDGVAQTPPLPPGSYWVERPQTAQHGDLTVVRGGGERKLAVVKPSETTSVEFGNHREPLQVVLTPPLAEGWTLYARDGEGDAPSRREAGEWVVERSVGSGLELSIAYHGETALVTPTVDLVAIAAEDRRPLLVFQLPTGALTATLGAGEMQDEVEWVSLDRADGSPLGALVAARPGEAFVAPYLSEGIWHVRWSGGHSTASVRSGQMTDLGTLESEPSASVDPR
jgi:hypothetical protein